MEKPLSLAKDKFLMALLALLMLGIFMNAFMIMFDSEKMNEEESDSNMFVESKEINQKKLEKIVVLGIQSLDKNKLTPQEMDLLSRERVSMGRPQSKARQVKIWSIRNRKGNKQCAIVNGVNILTATTMETAKNMLSFSNIGTVLLIADRIDSFTEDLVYSTFHKKFVDEYDTEIDADYQFILQPLKKSKCEILVYLSHNFEIDDQSAVLFSKSLASLSTETSKGQVWFKEGGGKVKDTKDLRETNLGSMAGWEFNQYLYVFRIEYLEIITPLNFAFYARFTIEEILLIPVLAIAQQSHSLLVLPVDKELHQLSSFSTTQFKEFELLNADKTGQELCFVSYPTTPTKNEVDVIKYLESLEKMELGELRIGIVMGGIYDGNGGNYKTDNSTTAVMKKTFEKLIAFKRTGKFSQVRFLMRENRTVSSLSIYESAYTHCPLKSIIVSSRFNVEFLPAFATNLWRSFTNKQHYFYAPFRYEDASDVISLERAPKWGKPYSFRENSTVYETHLEHLQIFKSELLRTNYFWVLKCKELDFYETEASFVFPMLEMIKLDIGIVGKDPLFLVHRRNKTETEQEQLENIRTYYEWTPLINNKLYPFPYNSLLNIAFRRNAPLKMSAIIHQVWQGENPSLFRLKLHSTLQETNPNFKMMLWRRENITAENFPMTFGLITRSLEYQKKSERSYFAPIASLIRYEAMYWHGGIYFDFKTEGMKSLTPFLKYEIFFTDAAVSKHRFVSPNNVGNPMMGATQHNYYLKIVLLELITQSKIDYKVINFPTLVGAYILRKSINDYEFFTGIGLGFHLFSPRPDTDEVSLCGTVTKFESDQEVFEVTDPKTEKIYNIGIPCRMYPEAYALMYKPLGRTWLGKK